MIAHTASVLKSAQRIIIKVGSSLVTNYGQGVDFAAVNKWVDQIAELRRQGRQIVFVSSGAIAEGLARLGLKTRPTEVNVLQAAASVGQPGLLQAYEQAFQKRGLLVAQILLTHEDLSDRMRYLNARSTLFTLLDMGVIPIVNENDTVITDEIRLGDNDTLGALVANLIEADALVILTDQSGLYDSDPRKNPEAKFISHETAGNPLLEQMAGGSGSSVGTGGMLTKILAAKRAANSGAHTVIVSGDENNVLLRLCNGEFIGTQLRASLAKRSARKQWLADHLRVSGQVVLDAGALRALTLQGKSLLPIGAINTFGTFKRGDVVSCVDEQGIEYARGLVNYSASDTRRILRKPTKQIQAILGYLLNEELIHRNNMVVLKKFEN